MKAVILAAGKGTRMKQVTQSIPKPMAFVKDKPILDHILRSIMTCGVKDFGIVVGYKQKVLQEYFQNGADLGASITYIEQKEQNGTGAALQCAREYTAGETFLFSFGDVITPRENYTRMTDFYKRNPCDVLIAANEVDDPYRGAAIYTDAQGNITHIIEKPEKGTSTTDLNNAGIMVLPPDIFVYTRKLIPSPRGEYELTDVFPVMIKEGRIVKAFRLSGYWKDVGTPADLKAVEEIWERSRK